MNYAVNLVPKIKCFVSCHYLDHCSSSKFYLIENPKISLTGSVLKRWGEAWAQLSAFKLFNPIYDPVAAVECSNQIPILLYEDDPEC